MAEYVASLAAEEGKGGSGGGGKNNNAEGEPLCIPTEVTITADNWPQEITWRIIDAETGNDVVTGIGDDLGGSVDRYARCNGPLAGVRGLVRENNGNGAKHGDHHRGSGAAAKKNGGMGLRNMFGRSRLVR
mmetsp:Transcript_23668/g.51098  ORF Transcript_23668/g.51098 Transcript_23668/m.51098 type:complete len:131 (+) Transcript_23668:962-1354(+)